MVEHGIIKWYDDRLHKRFGFITVLDADGEATAEEIWFHANDQHGACDRRFSHTVNPFIPSVGTRVVFE